MKALALCLAFPVLLASQTPKEEDEKAKMERVHIMEQENVVAVFVPAGNLVMIFEKGDLAEKKQKGVGSTANPRYFYFQNENGSKILSGWFEPASRFKGLDQDWEENVKAWAGKPEQEPHNVSKFEESNWKAIQYHTKHPAGLRVHIKAHWIQEGTWIDIHMSAAALKTTEEAEQQLKTLLKSLFIKSVAKKG